MGSRGMYLNKWTLDFSLENDIPSAILVWVCLSFLPLHCWKNETIRIIRNTLVKYIDRVEPQEGILACAQICVEMDLEKGLPEYIQLTLDNWTYIQQVDNEQLLFKCKSCHEYGNFAKTYIEVKHYLPTKLEREQWEKKIMKEGTRKENHARTRENARSQLHNDSQLL
jgi:hypothetical protein